MSVMPEHAFPALYSMQQPTCVNLRIRSVDDALRIFTAVRQGLLYMVSRRLNLDERLSLSSGCIYVWEERKGSSVSEIERFTEGKKWTNSRIQDEFFYYDEKYSPPLAFKNLSENSQPPSDWVPLVKQTYSVVVKTENGNRKWHLTAYFTQVLYHQLETVDDIPRIRELAIPEGIFKSSRSSKKRSQKNRFQPDERRLDMTMAAMRQSPITYEIQCPLPLSPPDNGGYHRHHYYAYSERPFPSNSHCPPSIATNLSNSITSTPSHSNNYHPYNQSRPFLPSSMITQFQSKNIEMDPLNLNYAYGYAYQAQAPPMNSFTPHDSTSYPLNSGYAPISPPLSLIPEGFPVSSLTMQNHLTSYVRPALGPLNAIHEPVRHPLDEDATLQTIRASQAI